MRLKYRVNEKSPRFGAQLDIAENKEFDVSDIMEPNFSSEGTFRANRGSFKRSFNIMGMINLAGKGSRLAVLTLSDAATDRMIGRMQVRFSDQVMFMGIIQPHFCCTCIFIAFVYAHYVIDNF